MPVSSRDLRGWYIWELYQVAVKLVDLVLGTASCSALQVATVTVLMRVKKNFTEPVAT